MRHGLLPELPAFSYRYGGRFGNLRIVVGVDREVRDRREDWKRDPALNFSDQLREQSGVRSCAFSVSLRGTPEAAKERRINCRNWRVRAGLGQKLQWDAEYERQLADSARSGAHDARLVLA